MFLLLLNLLSMLSLLLLSLPGPAAAPSMEVDMGVAEFVHRLHPSCRLPPLIYTNSPQECYYMQADVPPQLLPDIKVEQLLHELFAGAEASTANGSNSSSDDDGSSSAGAGGGSMSGTGADAAAAGGKLLPSGVAVSQAQRLWVSPPGAVSPCHYDTSTSFLLQLRGTKRMLFFSPDQLPALAPYPDTHLLRRRARLNLIEPQWERYPLGRYAGLGAREVVLKPGDAIVFPARWAHYTESCSTSVSVTVRLQAAGQQQQQKE